MSMTARTLVALGSWAEDFQELAVDQTIRVWAAHFHQHDIDDDACIAGVVASSRNSDIDTVLSLYWLSTEIIDSSLIIVPPAKAHDLDRILYVSTLHNPPTWQVRWRLDDDGQVDLIDAVGRIHLRSMRALAAMVGRKRRIQPVHEAIHQVKETWL